MLLHLPFHYNRKYSLSSDVGGQDRSPIRYGIELERDAHHAVKRDSRKYPWSSASIRNSDQYSFYLFVH